VEGVWDMGRMIRPTWHDRALTVVDPPSPNTKKAPHWAGPFRVSIRFQPYFLAGLAGVAGALGAAGVAGVTGVIGLPVVSMAGLLVFSARV